MFLLKYGAPSIIAVRVTPKTYRLKLPVHDLAAPGDGGQRMICVSVRACRILSLAIMMSVLGIASGASAQVAGDYMSLRQPTADPRLNLQKVLGFSACIKCHANEAAVWKTTKHHTSFFDLHRQPAAKQIAARLGLSSIKYSDRCVACHYTQAVENQAVVALSSVSCENCHGASRDWVANHFPPETSIGNETLEQKAARICKNIGNGMRNRHNTYTMARICMRCHNVTDEQLVNQGGHNIGTPEFEMVAWSQGMMRHRFVSGKGLTNAPNSADRLSVMFVAGIIADLEFSLRATANATSAGPFGQQVAQRAAVAAKRLASVYKKTQLPVLRQIVELYMSVQLRINNKQALDAVADRIADLGVQFAAATTGQQLLGIGDYVPQQSDWFWGP